MSNSPVVRGLIKGLMSVSSVYLLAVHDVLRLVARGVLAPLEEVGKQHCRSARQAQAVPARGFGRGGEGHHSKKLTSGLRAEREGSCQVFCETKASGTRLNVTECDATPRARPEPGGELTSEE
eukprot:3848677-Pyramimonas_sp.AAC.1